MKYFAAKKLVIFDKILFLSELGMFEYDIEYPKEFRTQNILLYYDERNQWPAVYKTNKTCKEKESVLFVPNGQVIYLNETTFRSGCFDSSDENMSGWIHCHSRRTFQSRRERWWFIAVSNCDTNKGLYLRYRITMTNDEHNLWFKHFSADELYILQVDICFLVLYAVLLLMSFIETQALRARHLFHRTYTLYLASLILECTGLACLCSYYAIYAQEGSAGIEIKLVVVYIILFLYERQFFDPGRVLYIYESPAGYGIIGLRLIGWAWFVYAVIFVDALSRKVELLHETLSTLLFMVSLSARCDSHFDIHRAKMGSRETTEYCGTLHFYRSSFRIFHTYQTIQSKQKFPVPCQNIGVMLQTNGTSPVGDNSLDKFAHHPYALTTSNAVPNYAAIFGVQANGNHTPATEMVTYGGIARPIEAPQGHLPNAPPQGHLPSAPPLP
ncbi:hypothetical protein CEXT_242492 [Caerostris extrusa]|uniref:Intimal thickness related receptor IRP domain-containing protein n=1 Tax=Caerostris extrusa TaxID=172846 RepID=A0AAV4TXW8_CAEEX|nr:hypothetical protein CEXT_242492 [Caerostris extrusa]